jgi:hypothetical protein
MRGEPVRLTRAVPVSYIGTVRFTFWCTMRVGRGLGGDWIASGSSLSPSTQRIWASFDAGVVQVVVDREPQLCASDSCHQTRSSSCSLLDARADREVARAGPD